MSIFALFIISFIILNVLQKKFPQILPESLRSWNFLPIYLRSLEPYDNFIRKYLMCSDCCQRIYEMETESVTSSYEKASIKTNLTQSYPNLIPSSMQNGSNLYDLEKLNFLIRT